MEEPTDEQLRKLAALCRIAVKEEELPLLRTRLSAILKHFESFTELDTEGVDPCNHVLALTNIFREDEVAKELKSETFLDNSPSQISRMIKVPPVIKKKSSST